MRNVEHDGHGWRHENEVSPTPWGGEIRHVRHGICQAVSERVSERESWLSAVLPWTCRECQRSCRGQALDVVVNVSGLALGMSPQGYQEAKISVNTVNVGERSWLSWNAALPIVGMGRTSQRRPRGEYPRGPARGARPRAG